ncbi:MAG: thioredoxin-disulfide reductase [Bdellovibrionales bacterium GWC1_52_8]|nr:MAG: thioredoxin-disulfide reductase [Bdellovibrionales bacterium GWA1_52_35]OFZ42558.1 MAG: thioredoxin-disulfide reductase [Bdellovibrionales bacterium GWC1_52_8]HCM40604.1 thioredoxin-disulfide reductase [Bdellovibrionales bacterium]
MTAVPNNSIELVTILGTGPAGLTAAIYAARANLRPLCIEGEQPGGQLTITSDVENFPGFPEPVMGPVLMDNFRRQAERFGTRIIQGIVKKADLSKRPFVLEFADGQSIKTRSLIIATGASAKWIGIPSERTLRGKGVSACATCDGFFFRNLDVAVVGGGDTALEEANFLTRFAKTVTIIHRRDKFRASKAMQEKVQKNSKIRFVWDSAVQEILGEHAVTGVRLLNLKTNETQDLALHGVFVAIGHEPNTGPFREQLKSTESGYLITEPDSTRTNIPGVFAAGDVADHVYRQAVTAAGRGCMAAIDAEHFLEDES